MRPARTVGSSNRQVALRSLSQGVLPGTGIQISGGSVLCPVGRIRGDLSSLSISSPQHTRVHTERSCEGLGRGVVDDTQTRLREGLSPGGQH